MADNKFIKHLRGEDTAKSVLEIKNQRTTTSFANMPDGDTSNANDVYSDYRGNATGVLKGTENWKLDGQNLVETTTVYGDGRDFTDSFSVFGNGLWVDASFAFATARRFSPNTKFVLKLCGHDLETVINHTVDFTLIVKFGASNLISKTFTVTEQAFDFCKEFVIDFAESNSETIKVDAGSTMQVQLLCADPAAQAVLYNGMTVFTALQRRVDADVVASDKKTFDEVVQDIIEVGEEIDRITDSLSDHVADKNNPHQVTKAQVGLGNVDNTSDLNKPISTATQNALDDITDLIPAQATPQNQLGDKNFINSSIATNTANFIGTFNSVAELNAYSGTKTNNDYAFVVATDSAGNTVYNRYKYTTATTPASWVFEYALNNSSFTAQQWASINSGVTTSDVSKARSAVQPSDLGNGTVTITQGGETKGTFTTNQATPATIELDQGGGAGHNVGDTFFTMRTDNELNGAVECNGATYNTTDFTGAQSVGNLLASNKIPYVSLATYATLLSTQGSCGVFGWDGVGTTAFRVPSLNDIFIETGVAAQIGDYIPAGVPNITGEAGMADRGANINASGAFVAARLGSSTPKYTSQTNTVSTNNGWTFDASRSSDVYKDDVDTVQPNTVRYRAMVQLATGATDEALETCTGVLADVAGLKSHEVIEFQAPTAQNNYTWYRKYRDGWIEQGQTKYASGGSGNKTITLPIEMADTDYGVIVSRNGASSTSSVAIINRDNMQSTTDITIYFGSDTGATWEVKGMYAQ